MRGGRSLLILLVVALGLGAYIYFVESERDPAGTDRREKVFAGLDRNDITELTIRASGADQGTALRRTDGDWTVVEPVQTTADASAVDAILSSLETLELERVIEEAPGNLEPFGLEPADVEVSFRTSDGASRTLWLGSTTPTSSGLYARTSDSPRLLLLPIYHRSTFNRTTFDLRNRRVLELAQATVDEVVLEPSRGPAVTLTRVDGTWRLAQPIDTRADAASADSLVSRLSAAQMTSIVHEGDEPTPADLRSWGLDRPRLTITARTGSATATLAIGAERDGSSVYARDLARPIVFTIDQTLFSDLNKSADDLRVRDIFAFSAFSARRLEVARDAATYVWEKKAGEGDDSSTRWTQVQPDERDVNQTTMTDLLNALSTLRAERFVAQAPASGSRVEVAVQSGSAEAPQDERATLVRAGDSAYAIRPGEPGAAVIPAADFDAVVSHLESLTAAAESDTDSPDEGQ